MNVGPKKKNCPQHLTRLIEFPPVFQYLYKEQQ